MATKTDTAPAPVADTARQAVTDLEQAAARWQAEIDDAAAAAERIEAEAGARLVDEQTTAAEVAADVTAERVRADAAARALDETRRRLTLARTAVLNDVAAHIDRLAEPAAAELDQHLAKVEKLVDQLSKLDGVRYVPEPEDVYRSRISRERGGSGNPGNVDVIPRGHTVALRQRVHHLRDRASKVRARAIEGLDAEQYRQVLEFADRVLEQLQADSA